jgi:hypothetical protein
VAAVPENFEWNSPASNSGGANGPRFGEFLGRQAVYLPSGLLMAKESDFRDGVVDVDIAAPPHSLFLGVAFRIESAANLEMVYFRPGASDTREAVQYTPRLNGDAIWQLLNSRHEKAGAHIVTNRWMHVKIAIRGRTCQVFLHGSETPTLTVTNLRRGDSEGGIGLWALGGGGYFSNLSFSPLPRRRLLPDLPPWKRAGVLSDWELSPAVDAGEVDAGQYPEDIQAWQPVHAEEPGFVLINRYRVSPAMFPMPSREAMTNGRVHGAKIVFARTHVSARRASEAILKIAYSDDIIVYLNRKRIFAGKNALTYRSDDALGTFGVNDQIHVHLDAGDNEILVAVTEYNGGWAFECDLHPYSAFAF